MSEFDDLVTVKSRTGEVIEILYDSRMRQVPAKKGLRLPREIAEIGIKQHAFRWNATNGLVKESKLYIEEDIDTPLALPHEPLDMDRVKEIKKTDGLGRDTILVDGKPIKKKTINLDPQGEDKEDFRQNNV